MTFKQQSLWLFILYPCVMTISALAPAAARGQEPRFERGVSFELATVRKATITNLEYDLSLTIQKSDPIPAVVTLDFDLAELTAPLVLDFNAPEDLVKDVQLNGNVVAYKLADGHIIIPQKALEPGKQTIRIEFTAGDQSLNRNEEFLYTLLVPDRASTVFPCFDQPDLKAKFKLKLSLPEGWVASANGALKAQTDNQNGRTTCVYEQTKPISTYLFAFAAGEFQTVTREIEGRNVTMLHRESDEEKVARNIDDIFTLHALSLNWMEDYTGIKYPFEKFDFVLVPSFPYGGMEHIGNIFYRADSLFLEESATQDQKLNRASLIAHETAHMWFGNLVTMKWFDDVWLKEVFANYMAAKIVNPSFPDINHDLGFMLKHHPSAYGEDRTGGTYPIQQELDNLKNAGTLYGRIIYMKAPIVMRQLETMIGRAELQDGLQEYLTKFSFDNAVWDDLIEILDAKTDVDLKQWSAAWVKESGTPELTSELNKNTLQIKQVRKTGQERYWAQQVDIKVMKAGKVIHQSREMIDGETTEITLPDDITDFDFYLANGSELGYGYFQLDEKSKQFLLANIYSITDDVTRGAAWLALYESFIRGEVDRTEFKKAIQRSLLSEQEPLNRQNLLNQLEVLYWRFLPAEERISSAPKIEEILWQWIDADPETTKLDAKSAYYKTLVRIANTDDTVKRLYKIWETQSNKAGLILGEPDYTTLAYELALRMPDQSDEILNTQLSRVENEDRKKRFAFVKPALSPDQAVRDEFFESLKQPKNRRPEQWALDGMSYLHHPLRSAEAEKYILPSLLLLEEIQTTGDIFFPKRWLVATFSGHRNRSAAKIVTSFLDERPDYSPRLKNKILQAADILLKTGK